MNQGATRLFASVIHEFTQSIGKENFYLIGEITGGRQQAFETLVLSRNKQSIFNHYCANCRCTQTFRDQGSHLSCPTCKKTLWPAATEACRRAG